MKFTIDQSVYSDILEKCKKALSKNDKNDNLKYIYHEANSEGLKLIATDLEQQIEYFIYSGTVLAIHEEGVACPYGIKLSELIKGYPNIKINVKLESSQTEEGLVQKFCLDAAKTEKRKLSHWVPCGEKDRFPNNAFKILDEPISIEFNPEDFIYILRHTKYAASREAIPPEFTNICIDVKDGVIKAAATDRIRISYVIRNANTSGEGRFLIFCPTAKDILELISPHDSIKIVTDGKILCLKQLNLTFYAKQIEAEFPNWEDNVKNSYSNSAKINRVELMEGLKNIIAVTDFGCVLNFDNSSQELKITAKTSSDSLLKSGGEETIPCTTNSDCNLLTIPRLLHEALQNSRLEEIEIFFGNTGDPFRINLDDNFNNIISVLEE